ncbi:MAG: MFS transporter [Chloroflexi bacterium]|nr:MFS transporter [Chloroflexota bacterium]
MKNRASRLRLGLPPAFRYPAYRAFWLGSLASVSGFQVLQFGQLWLVHQLEPSPLFLGYVGVANALPAIVLSLFGGLFADRLDKRRLIIVTQTTSAALTFLLATLTLMGKVRVEHVLIIALFTGAVQAFDQPARQALFPQLIERKALMNAVALNSAIWQGTRIVAPAAAGVIISLVGTEAAFYATCLGFLTMAGVMYLLKVPRVERRAPANAGRELLDGLQFIKRNSVFSFLIGMTFFNSFFGLAYIMLMPVFAVDILKVGAEGQGVLLSASGIGALLSTLWMASLGNVPRKGLLLIGGATMAGLSVAAFGLTSQFIRSYPLALALMPLIGVFTSVYMISIMTSLQTMVPDGMRGRVMGVYGMTWSIMPLGGMQAGAVASIIGAPFAIAIGGLAVAAFALGPALVNPRVRNLGSLLRQFETARPGGRSP